MEENCPNPKTTLASIRLAEMKKRIEDFRKGQMKLTG
jgi:hypothetical protein